MTLPKSTFKFILRFARIQKYQFILFMLISVIWAVNDTVYPYFLKRIVNIVENYHGEPAGIYAAVSGVLSIVVIFWVVSEIFQRIQGILQIYVFPKFRANIREAVFKYVQSHSHEYFSNHFAGNLAKKLADLPTSSQSIMEIICFQFVTATVGAIIVLVMMWNTKPLFAVILFVWLCIHLSLASVILRYADKLWVIHSDAVSTLSGKIVDAFMNIMNVRLFARTKFEIDYLSTYQKDEINKAKKAMWLMEWTRLGLGLNGLFLIFSMLFTLLYGWAHQWVTLGDFTQISMQSFWLLGWMWFISYQMTVFVRETGTVGDALTLVRKKHDLIDKNDAKPLIVSQGKIQFEEVSFGYRKKQVVFDQLNMTIAGGQKIGLVGFSGSGKSTLVNLILRFYDVNSGRILIDGQDISTITQDSLRKQVAMIPQDPSLFHRSLMENIRYGRLDASDEEVIEASKLAHCHEFIEKIDEGYQALVGERGIKLSGGQRQRIAIARAILKNAPILILDEATSSLDSVTEKLIQESLHILMKGRTTLVVAHRLSTLADMDKIFVFHKGKVIEEGSKDQLLKAEGHFAMLWNMQTDGFLPDKEGE